MLKTKMTKLFGIQHPIMLAGMNFVTEPKLVAAVCNAGGLGIIATAHFTSEEIRQNIREIRKLTDKPFGINQVLHLGQSSKEAIQIAIEEKVPVINYSLGKPWFIEQVHEYGGKVLGTVALAKHAVKAAHLGCDAIVITGHEAAAHGADATSLILIPIVADQVEIPIIAAGGFHDGRGLAAALALGADGISMGTRFAMTRESVVHENFKQLCIQATEQDTLYSARFDGMPGRVLKTKIAEEMLKGGFPLFTAIQSAMQVKKMMNLSLGQFVSLSFQMMKAEDGSPLLAQAQEAVSVIMHNKAIFEGDVEKGILSIGQDCGAIKDLPTVKELIDSVIAGAETTLETIRKKVTTL